MKTNSFPRLRSFLIEIGAPVLAVICFSTQTHADPVLPAAGAPAACGYLEVYSATESRSPAGWGEEDFYAPHSSYCICNADGKKIRTVANHGPFPGEGPDKVALAPGPYIVKARAESEGLVTVPVSIKLARITTVYLEYVGPSDIFDPARPVRSPRGQIVGWEY